MQFGVPSQRRASTKVEKYEFAVATTVIAEEKKTRSILFNSAAVELLGLPEVDAEVAFAFNPEEMGIFIVNATENDAIPEEHKIKVTKSEPRRIADKRTYEYILKLLELTDQEEQEFQLTAVTIDDTQMIQFNHMSGAGEKAMEEEVTETQTDAGGEEDVYDADAPIPEAAGQFD